MLAINATKPQKCTPNLLPARINHAGPINDTKRYWKPETDEKGTHHAFFRGRHLHGISVPLPANYTGAVLHMTDKLAPQAPSALQDDNDDDEETEQSEAVETKVAEQIASFDEIVVWEHGGAMDVERDAYVRGLGEWVGWAGSMHDVEGEVEGKAK